MSIEFFKGTWRSAGHRWHTNPEEPVPNEPSARWPFRAMWYPDHDVEFIAKVVPRAIYHSYDSPKTASSSIDIIKFKFTNDGNLDPGVVQAIEQADYHYEGGLLISTPIRLEAQIWVVDVIQYLPIRTPIPGDKPSEQPAMRHNLLWQDGLRTKWICCPSNAAETRKRETAALKKTNTEGNRGRKRTSKS